MAKAESKTARANEPAFPCEEVHGDGTQILRRHLGLTIYEETVLRMAAAIVTSPDTSSLSFEDVSERAIAQADSLVAKLEQRS